MLTINYKKPYPISKMKKTRHKRQIKVSNWLWQPRGLACLHKTRVSLKKMASSALTLMRCSQRLKRTSGWVLALRCPHPRLGGELALMGLSRNLLVSSRKADRSMRIWRFKRKRLRDQSMSSILRQPSKWEKQLRSLRKSLLWKMSSLPSTRGSKIKQMRR